MTANNQVAEANVKYLVNVTGQTVPAGYSCPPGYKQTEVGMIPEDWIVAEIKDILTEISMGPFGSDIKVSNFVGSGVPVLNGYNVSSERLIDIFTNFVTHTKAKSLKKAVASRGDIVVTHRGTIGQISYIPEDSEYPKYVISQSQFRAKFNNSVLPSWITTYFLSSKGAEQLLEGKGHTGVPAIAQPTTTFRKLKVPLPSLAEQTAIANALSDADALINELEKLIAKKQAIKTATMQQLLTGRARLPQFALYEDGIPKGYKESELGEIPEDWFVTTIASRHQIATGNTPPTLDQSNYGGEYLFVSPADLDESKYIKDTEKKLSVMGFSLARSFPAGSTLFTCIGSTIGKTGLASVELTSNQQINAVFPNDVDDEEFTYYLLDYISPKVKKLAGEQAVPIVNKSEFGETQYALPSAKEEQTDIANILSDMDEEIQTLQKRLAKTRQIKQGMMQELLTGKTRLIQSKPSFSINDRKEYAHEQ